MKINVRPVAPKPIPVSELKAGEKFTSTLCPGACVYTRLNVPLASPYAALTDTLGLARLDANQSVYRHPAEPATTTVGELEVGDLFQKPDNPHVFMITDAMSWTLRACVALDTGRLEYRHNDTAVIKVEVVE